MTAIHFARSVIALARIDDAPMMSGLEVCTSVSAVQRDVIGDQPGVARSDRTCNAESPVKA